MTSSYLTESSDDTPLNMPKAVQPKWCTGNKSWWMIWQSTLKWCWIWKEMCRGPRGGRKTHYLKQGYSNSFCDYDTDDSAVQGKKRRSYVSLNEGENL